MPDAPPPTPFAWMGLGVSALDVGEQVVLEARDAAAGETVTFLRGASVGSGPCPAQIGGNCLQITSPLVIGRAVADPTGLARLTFRLPAVPAGQSVAFQAAVASAQPRLSEPQLRTTRPNGASGVYDVGANFPLPGPAMIQVSAIFTDTVDLTEPVAVDGFSCLGDAVSGFFKGGLYTDIAGRPDTLVAHSGSHTVSPGVNTAPNLDAPVVLQPGRYWLATAFDGRVYTFENTEQLDNPEWVTLQPFNFAMPATFSAGALGSGPRYACSLRVR